MHENSLTILRSDMNLVSISNSYCVSLCEYDPCESFETCDHTMNSNDHCEYDNYDFGMSGGIKDITS